MDDANKYRITTATLVVIREGLCNVARTITEGAVVMATKEAFESNTLVEVQWEEKIVLMFAEDLRTRAVLAD